MCYTASCCIPLVISGHLAKYSYIMMNDLDDIYLLASVCLGCLVKFRIAFLESFGSLQSESRASYRCVKEGPTTGQITIDSKLSYM